MRLLWVLVPILPLLGCGLSGDPPTEDAGVDPTPPPTPAADPCEGPELTEVERLCCTEPTIPDFGFQGLITDAHHHYLDGDQSDYAVELLTEMNATGSDRAVLSNAFIEEGSWTIELAREAELSWGEMAVTCDRFLPLLAGFELESDTSLSYVSEQLQTGRFAGVGTLNFGNVHNALSPDSTWLRALLDIVEEEGAVFGLHVFAPSPDFDGLAQRVYALAGEYPDVPFLCLGCFGGPSNVYSTRLADEGLLAGDLLGFDVMPEEYASLLPGDSGLPYQYFAEGVDQARVRLQAELSEPQRSAFAGGKLAEALGLD